ncbi:hypothetical protein [Streptomyces sp. NPDC002553]|uniref:hypothetical protein n=1 Tax=Streptomyces sp. NPDC002553 TaxID=3154417 RepID=UPI0033206757
MPQELGFGSGMTCWRRLAALRRLAAWNEAGVWDELHLVLLKKLDWSRAVIDFSHCGPVGGAHARVHRLPAR